MKKHNILYIEDTRGRGGSVVSLCNLLEYLDKEKFHPYALLYQKSQELYLKDRCKDVKTIVARPRESLKTSVVGTFIIKCTMLLGRHVKMMGSFLIFLTDFLFIIFPYVIRVYFTVKEWKIHLVHLNTGVCIPGILLAKLLRVPCVVTQRGPEWESPIISLFSRYVTFFMANSSATKKNVQDLGVNPSKIMVVYPTVDLKEFNFNKNSLLKRDVFNLCTDDFVIGILGTVVEIKGHKILFQAMVEVSKVIPNCKVFVIGDTRGGTDEYKKELIAFADKLGIQEKIIFTGFRKDVPELIQLLDVVVHASLYPEPFGKVIIEGMAMKKPVIATLGGGTTEIIDNGYNGFLIPPNDSEKLAKIIIKLLLNDDLRKNIGEAAWQDVNARFAIGEHVKKVEKLYDTIL